MPNLIDHLRFRARLQPESTALQTLSRSLTNIQLFTLVQRIAQRLRESGIRPGDVVLTSIPDQYRDWIVTLALFHEAAVAAAYNAYPAQQPGFAFDWVIADRKDERFPSDRTILIDREWMTQAFEGRTAIEPIQYASDDSIVRITTTSGTTGTAKAIAQTLGMVQRRASNVFVKQSPYRSYFHMMPLASGLGFEAAMMSLISGQPLYFEGAVERVVELINRHQIEAIKGSTMQIAELTKAIARLGLKVPSVRLVQFAGSPASPSLIESITQHLCDTIINDYGSTETSWVGASVITDAKSPPTGGFILPGVDVEIVDENDEPLAQGSVGIVRIRTPAMAHEYLDNPEATAQSFRNGWFYPGDRGRIRRNGMLMLGGRTSELINSGGVKIDPSAIDQFLLGWPGIEDAASCGMVDEAGVPFVGAALIGKQDLDLDALKSALIDQFGSSRAPTAFFRVPKIPRTESGKVMRAVMSRALTTAIARQKAGESWTDGEILE